MQRRGVHAFLPDGLAQSIGLIPVVTPQHQQLAVYPDRVPPQRYTTRDRAFLPSLFAPMPPPNPVTPPLLAALTVQPARDPWRRDLRRLYPSFFEPAKPFVAVAGVGPAGAATFAMTMQPGARVTFSWGTDILRSWAGLEQRVQILTAPNQRYQATCYLLDGDDRALRSNLFVNAAQGQPFLIALPYEELILTGSGTTVLPVWSTAFSDWLVAGQRAVVVAPDNASFVSCVVQLSTANTITIDVDASSVARAGARIMPTMAVYLDPQQGLGRYPVNVEEWQLAAQAIQADFGGAETLGTGATVTTFGVFPVWDRGVSFEGQPSSDSLQSLSEIIDYGAVLSASGAAAVVDWGRQVAYSSPLRADWQWFKAFMAATQGRRLPFLLPTGHVDILFKAKVSDTTITVYGAPTAGAGDPLNIWLRSGAHQWISILCTDGTRMIADIAAMGDNGDGTANISFGVATLAGKTPKVVSWAEQVHFESDDFETTWNGSTFSYSGLARVVQQ